MFTLSGLVLLLAYCAVVVIIGYIINWVILKFVPNPPAVWLTWLVWIIVAVTIILKLLPLLSGLDAAVPG